MTDIKNIRDQALSAIDTWRADFEEHAPAFILAMMLSAEAVLRREWSLYVESVHRGVTDWIQSDHFNAEMRNHDAGGANLSPLVLQSMVMSRADVVFDKTYGTAWTRSIGLAVLQALIRGRSEIREERQRAMADKEVKRTSQSTEHENTKRKIRRKK